jgi:hypothetical protein
MKWGAANLRQLSVLGPQYGANAGAIERSGKRPRYIRITDIRADGQLLVDGAVEADIADENEFKLVDGDLLFARSGNTVGKTYRYKKVDGPSVFAGYLIRFRFNPDLVDSRYVFFYTQSADYKQWLLRKRRVGGQPNVNGAEYASLVLPLAPITEQRRIVDLLEQADVLRRLRAEADQNSDQILPAIFHKMFGDAATNSKNLPKQTLVEAGAKVRYGLGQPPQSSDTGLPLIRATNIHCGLITVEDMIYVKREDVPESRNAFLKAEEVIVVRSGAYTGDIAQVTERWAGSVAGYDMVVSPGDRFTGEFIESYLLTPLIQRNYFGNIKARAGQPHLNSDQLLNTPMLVPPKPLQEKFSRFVVTLRNQQVKRSESLKNLNNLFAAMLHRAFTGELTAKWREAHLKELLVEMEHQAKLLRTVAENN